jgi:hypothetical protein
MQKAVHQFIQASDFDDALLSALFKPLGGPIKGRIRCRAEIFIMFSMIPSIAVKRPVCGYYTESSFFDECMQWINLGFHPNIVTCYYVRTLTAIIDILRVDGRRQPRKYHSK